MIQIAITPTGLRYHEAWLPSPYNYPVNTLSDSTGKTYSWVSYDVEVAPDEWEYKVSFVVATFDESKSELDVIAVIPPPPAYYTMYGYDGGMWHVRGYVDDKDDFYAAISTEDYSEERLYRWDWGTNQWVDLPGWVQISELGSQETFTYFLKPNKPLGWVALDENKVANVFADGNVVTTSNKVIAAVGPYVYTYNPLTWAIEIFSPAKNSTTLGEPIAIHDLERELRDPGPGNWDWYGRDSRASLAPGDSSIVFYHEYDDVALEINLEWVKEYYEFDFPDAFYYLGQPSAKPRFWTNLIGCNENP